MISHDLMISWYCLGAATAQLGSYLAGAQRPRWTLEEGPSHSILGATGVVLLVLLVLPVLAVLIALEDGGKNEDKWSLVGVEWRGVRKCQHQRSRNEAGRVSPSRPRNAGSWWRCPSRGPQWHAGRGCKRFQTLRNGNLHHIQFQYTLLAGSDQFAMHWMDIYDDFRQGQSDILLTSITYHLSYIIYPNNSK